MLSALNRLTSQLMRITLAACLGLCLMLTARSGAGASGLTGDYVEDTLSLIHI